jgi:arylformamidase
LLFTFAWAILLLDEEENMRIYDISLTISPQIPTWPGDPKVVLERFSVMEQGSSSYVSRIEMSTHTGTHVDAPYHFINNGMTVDKLDLKILNGRVYVLHLPNAKEITGSLLEKSGIPPRTRRIIFKTRNSEYWSKNISDFQTAYVGLSADGAQYLVDHGVKLIGVDYLSVAPYQPNLDSHKALLNANVIIVEGLDLSHVSQGRYMLYCLPIKLGASDGAPARAILVGV